MRRRSRASSKVANTRSRKAKTLRAARHSRFSVASQETEVAQLRRLADSTAIARRLAAPHKEALAKKKRIVCGQQVRFSNYALTAYEQSWRVS
jgi:hypothetical protein